MCIGGERKKGKGHRSRRHPEEMRGWSGSHVKGDAFAREDFGNVGRSYLGEGQRRNSKGKL